MSGPVVFLLNLIKGLVLTRFGLGQEISEITLTISEVLCAYTVPVILDNTSWQHIPDCREKYVSFSRRALTPKKQNTSNEYWFPMPSCWICGDGSMNQGKWAVWSCGPGSPLCLSPCCLQCPDLRHCELRTNPFFWVFLASSKNDGLDKAF